MRYLPAYVLSLLIFFSFTTYAPAAEQSPGRIISLSPAITEALFLLGVEDRLVGVTLYCVRPQGAKKKEKVGTIVEVDVERIIKLKPDTVYATTLNNQRDIRRIKNLGIDVKIFDIAKGYDGLCDVFLELGRLTGREGRAKELIYLSNQKIGAIRERIVDKKKLHVFIQLGVKPLFAATKEQFINDLIEYAGGENIFFNAPSGTVSREEVIMKDPDVILITTMGIPGERERAKWQRLSSMRAVKTRRIYLIDSDTICSPTPVSFVHALEVVAGLLHPEAL
ncbi:MAG: ABC transporter substrate-binding protein [Syntrophorhabdaceae bacterium]|nr:ABC transporter substrate-binding protein [Syntrophorhabdaceae bacterium]